MEALITGFEPFGDNATNPTQRLVEVLSTDYAASRQDCARLRAQLLPVSFTRARTQIQRLAAQFRPRIVLCTGLSTEARSLLVERIAVNEQAGADNDALALSGAKVDAAGADGLFATIDAARLSDFLAQRGLKTEISWHAGTYVCNTALYTAVQSASQYGGKAGFLHVPADVDVHALAAALYEWAEAESELAAAGRKARAGRSSTTS